MGGERAQRKGNKLKGKNFKGSPGNRQKKRKEPIQNSEAVKGAESKSRKGEEHNLAPFRKSQVSQKKTNAEGETCHFRGKSGTKNGIPSITSKKKTQARGKNHLQRITKPSRVGEKKVSVGGREGC